MKNLKIIIEIPKDSPIKYEYDRFTNKIVVDRVLRGEHKYPANYGFIPKTLDWDGDELDVILYSNFAFHPGVTVDAKIVGAMRMKDDGETDTKLIAIHNDDYRHDNIKSINDLPKEFLEEIKKFFLSYKRHKGEVIQITGFEDADWALKEYKECVDLYSKYKSMPKDKFIAQMKKEHPEKY